MATHRVQICSDLDYDNLIAEVYIDDWYVALVSREDPDGPFHVEFPGPDAYQAGLIRTVEFDVFVAALVDARAKLGGG